MISYSLNTKSHYKTLSFLGLILGVLSFLAIINFKSFQINRKAIIGFWLMLIIAGPAVILYLNYLFHSVGKRVIIDLTSEKISLQTKNKTKSFELKNVETVLKICSHPVAESRTQWIPTDPFFYIKIVMKDGQSIVITSLMTDNHFSLYGHKIKIEKRLIAII